MLAIIRALALVALALGVADAAYYLPGVSPHTYQQYDNVMNT
jgi:hypothetical protein